MTRLRRFTRQAWLLALATTCIALAGTEMLMRSGLLTGAEHVYSDLWHRIAGVRHSPAHTALVMIDDPSLTARPDEPLAFWTPHFARATRTLREVGVRLVAIDFIFSGSPERWIAKLGLTTGPAARDYDQPFRQQINSGDVLLAGLRVGKGERIDDFVLPSPDYLLALPNLDMASHIGLANLRSDPDGAVRHFTIAEAGGPFVEREGLPRLSFGGLAAARALGLGTTDGPYRFGPRIWSGATAIPVAFAGPPGTYPVLSFETLLRPDASMLPEVRALAGKVVVIGAGYAGINDVHPTPYSTTLLGANELMPGPEIQANIIETLLGGKFAEPLATSVRIPLFVGIFALLAFVGVRLSPWRALLLVLLVAQASSLVAYFAFVRDVLFPLAHLQIGTVVVLVCLVLLRLTREERERAHIGSVLGRYVSGQVMTTLLDSPDLPELGGQSCEVTVLFSDIRNFTTISERLSAKEVVEMLNNYFERACTVLLAEGATIDKFIGDAIMAEFGAPLAQPDHARRALRAAVALRQVALEFRGWMRHRFGDRDLPEFDIGIGLHSGEAVVGNIGASVRMEYTAIGDTVNLASRLEGRTKDTGCHILASEDTIRLAGEGVTAGASHLLNVKGRNQPVRASEILSAA
ncbi:MAG: adenylate/guanylate cyclase domain-containing protein [Pseudomonadota bacterium]